MRSIRNAEQILRPAKSRFIFLTLFLAFCFQLLPLGQVLWQPDLLLMVLSFWALYQPQRIGIGVAFFLGLAMDVQSASLLGMHAFSYVVMVLLVQSMQIRLLWYQAGLPQAILLFMPFMLAMLLQMVIGWMSSRMLPSPWLLLAPLLQVFLWPMVRRVMLAPQLSPMTEKERRPS